MFETVEYRPFIQVLGEQIHNSPYNRAPGGEHLLYLVASRRRDHFLVVGPWCRFCVEGNHVHERLVRDGEVQEVRFGTNVRMLVFGFVRSQCQRCQDSNL